MSCAISILIVSFNTRELTLSCLRSILEQTCRPIEIVLVDNASTDCSAEAVEAEHPEVRLIRSGRNLGFAAANNLAAKHVSGQYLLLLNPDTVVLDGAIDKLLAFAERTPLAGIWGGRTVFADGSLNSTCCHGDLTFWSLVCRGSGLGLLLGSSPRFNQDRLAGWDRNSERAVPIVSGCFLLIRRDLWEQLGGFDPRFSMYGEEFDLCMRARALGYQPMFTPEATIIHYGGASESLRADQVVRHFVAKARLMRKHWPRPKAWLGERMLDMWVFNKMVRAVVLRNSIEKNRHRGTWADVWRRRSEWRASGTWSGVPST